ncbi:MAG: hypothetical protein ACJAT9_000378 [Polaribacter sp.]|jgi:hypothetical protein
MHNKLKRYTQVFNNLFRRNKKESDYRITALKPLINSI